MHLNSAALQTFVYETAVWFIGDRQCKRRALMLAVKDRLIALGLWETKDDEPSESAGKKGAGLAAIDYRMSDLKKAGLLENPTHDTWCVSSGVGQGLADEQIWYHLVQARRGQGKFRCDLLEHWGGRCCVTGFANTLMLVASHIKPWCDSTNDERLDQFNGLLLSPSYDRAFDRGLISFSDSGQITLASDLAPREAEQIGISPEASIDGILAEHSPYLHYHQQHVFRKG